MAYTFDVKLQAGKYEIQIDTRSKYGYFEHDLLGDEAGGGLWFDRVDPSEHPKSKSKLELIDYDGMACLPYRVREVLREAGFRVGPEFE